MNIAFVYPPFTKDGNYPLITQNRQFKYAHSLNVKIYPVVMSYAATRSKNLGFNTVFLDGINERLVMSEFYKKLKSFEPSVIITEGKAPLMPSLWKWSFDIKAMFPNTTLIIVGDHPSYFPNETLEKSAFDFVLKGGDYDFVLEELLPLLKSKSELSSYPSGVVYKNGDKIIDTGSTKAYRLENMPLIDRELTKWGNYGEAYLHRPVAYILSGRGCGLRSGGAGVCTFCIWQHALWNKSARLRPAKEVVAEIKYLYETYGIKEVFDDNEGGFAYDEGYCNDFLNEMKIAGVLGKVYISMNARADSLTPSVCKTLKSIGVRLLKIGVESANDQTLKSIAKLETAQKIRDGIKNAKDSKLVVLLTNMVGYPWESEDDIVNSYNNLKSLMFYKTRFGDSLQASIVVAYPGAPLFNMAIKENWLLIDKEDYEKYDMSYDILKSQIDTDYWVKKFWKIQMHPIFLLRSFLSLRSIDDIRLAFRGLQSLLGHVKDYKNDEC